MSLLSCDQFPWKPEEWDSASERFARLASQILELRFMALSLGSLELTAALERALVQACIEAGVGPTDSSDETVSHWLAGLLTAAAKANPSYGKALPVCAPMDLPLDFAS